MDVIVVAMALLMWQWTQACLALAATALAGREAPLVLAAVVLAVAAGGAALVAMAWLVLPASVVSQGWSRETLDAARHATVAVAVAIAGIGLLQAHGRWRPGAASPARPRRK